MSPTTTFPKEYSLLSNNNVSQDTTALVGLVISGKLDITKVENAHVQLVRLWPALGGKLVTTKTPYGFTSGDIVNFKARRLEKKLSELSLPTASSVSNSNSNSNPTLHPLSSNIDKFFHFDSIEEIPPPDTIFALRVTVLRDATLLGFRFAHHLCDGYTCFEVVSAFCDVLSGRPILELVPPPDIDSLLSKQVPGLDSLPNSVVDDSVRPELNLTLSVWGALWFSIIVVIRRIMLCVGLRDDDEERNIHIPRSFVTQLMDECRDEKDKLGEKELEVTKNNVIMAWLLKSFYSKLAPSQEVGLDIMTSFSYRPHIPPPQPNTTYLHNSFYMIRTPFTSLAYFHSLPPSEIAKALRKTCLMHKQPLAVKANLQFCENRKTATVPHPPDRKLTLLVEHEMSFFSHWTGFEYYRLDFWGALDQEGGFEQDGLGVTDAGTDTDRGGKVVFTLPSSVFPYGFKLRPLLFVIKDGLGGYWIRARLTTTGWKGMEESILQQQSY